MAVPESQFTATAGEHLVAYHLAYRGAVPVLVRQAVRTFDLLASSADSAHAVGIIVKTAVQARREGPDGPYLEFPFSPRVVQRMAARSIVCFVDLRGRCEDGGADIYVLPIDAVRALDGELPALKYVQPRFTRSIAQMEPFRNNWAPLCAALQLPIDDDVPVALPPPPTAASTVRPSSLEAVLNS